MAKFLLDTNYLADALKDENLADPNEPEKNRLRREWVKADLEQKLSSGKDELFITQLIRYEFMRFFTEKDDIALGELLLAEFEVLDIKQEAADLAIELFRLRNQDAKSKGMKLSEEKHNFDFFHFAVAQTEGLKLLSNDEDDFKTIRQIYEQHFQAA